VKPIALSAVPASAFVRGDPERLVRGVQIDSRLVRPGDLFVAIRGGAQFAADAVERGAAGVVLEEEALGQAGDAPDLLMTFSSVRCLQCLGDVNAQATDATRVGITGSAGKTSTKDAIAHLIADQRRTVVAAEGHNNEIGYPLTLTRIEEDTEVAVLELAMRGPGQIAELCALAAPDIAVITNIGEAHIELLGSRAAIAQAKAEILHGVRGDGPCVIPFAEPLLDPQIPPGVRIVTFGEEAGADVQLVDRRPTPDGQELSYLVDGALLPVATNLPGRHHARNLAAAIAVARALGLDLGLVAERARDVPIPSGRGEVLDVGGIDLVNDAYNANPSSTEAALRLLAETPVVGRRIAVLGRMAELGEGAEAYHREVGALAARVGVDIVIAVGDQARAYLDGAGGGVDGHWVPDPEAAVERLLEVSRPGDRVLVKGSKVAGLRPLPESFRERRGEATA
jgi:UDP-N-acetylmuramoyl-tripeptide--D-alanyl-D-alanine ligase